MHERLTFYQTFNSLEQPGQGDEVAEKNNQIAHRRMRSRTENPQECENSNSPETGVWVLRFLPQLRFFGVE